MTPTSPSGSSSNDWTDVDLDTLLSMSSARPVPPHLEREAEAIHRLRTTLLTPTPSPSAELEAFLARPSADPGSSHPAVATRSRRAVKGPAAWFVGLGLAAQLGVGSAAAAAGIAAAGAADLLPAPIQRVFDSVVDTMRPEDRNDQRDGNQQPVDETDATPIAEIVDRDPLSHPGGENRPRDDRGEQSTSDSGDSSASNGGRDDEEAPTTSLPSDTPSTNTPIESPTNPTDDPDGEPYDPVEDDPVEDDPVEDDPVEDDLDVGEPVEDEADPDGVDIEDPEEDGTGVVDEAYASGRTRTGAQS